MGLLVLDTGQECLGLFQGGVQRKGLMESLFGLIVAGDGRRPALIQRVYEDGRDNDDNFLLGRGGFKGTIEKTTEQENGSVIW
jgi:hypothetical protein